MNEQQARERGYSFTGHYNWDKEEVMANRDRLREKGYKAVLVTVPDNPLSRSSHGRGYSVYAEQRYFIDQEVADINKRLEWLPQELELAKKTFAEVLDNLSKKEENLRKRREILLQKLVGQT